MGQTNTQSRDAGELNALERKARWVRRTVLEAIASTGKGHIGGTYSCTDILVALYYGGILRVDPARSKWPDRDRLLVGKGHACLAFYAILADMAFMPTTMLEQYGRDGGLGGQLDVSIPGVEYNTGSLGHVLGIAAGMALAARMDSRPYRVYALMGDAECYEGSVWEALGFAGEQVLANLVAIVDRNRLSVTDVLPDDGCFKDFRGKVIRFGWDCYEVDGHSFPDLLNVLERARMATKPCLIIANTVKGKGVSFMENGVKWHHAVPDHAQLAQARKELATDAS